MNGLFITGTDTGIGKTVLTALLLAELRRRGLPAAAMKPVQTGCEKEGVRLEASDLRFALALAEMKASDKDRALMSPYRFEPACSPHLAAEQAGVEIETGRILAAARELAAAYRPLLVEGAGGVLVPLNRRELMIDLMRALGLPVLLAARPGLGTINHTLLSLRALRAAGLTIAGVVLMFSNDAPPGLIEEDNRNAIEQLGGVPVLGAIPYCVQLRAPGAAYAALPLPVAAETERLVNRLNL